MAAGAHDQELVLFDAVSVFMSFFVGPVAMARFERAERRYAAMVTSVVGALLVEGEADQARRDWTEA